MMSSDEPVVVLADGSVRLTIDTAVYRLSAVQKTGYRLAKRLTLALGVLAGTRLTAVLLPAVGTRMDVRELIELFYRELCDQELRESIGEQTKDVRALLLAHAFSRTDLVKRE
jgi:His-Xaa-Ser system protein HxsD